MVDACVGGVRMVSVDATVGRPVRGEEAVPVKVPRDSFSQASGSTTPPHFGRVDSASNFGVDSSKNFCVRTAELRRLLT